MSDVSRFIRELTPDEIEGGALFKDVRCYRCALSKRYRSLDGLRCLAWEVDGLPARVEPNGWCYRGKERNG